MIVLLIAMLVVGLTTMGLVAAKLKELHDFGYSWSYSFFKLFGGL